jgi:alkanesulfonate monooxygenase SsuD/methylene tetrahydromethanopterin reductase-like flavin-dependent oxidoreductase (luciferase family)
MAATVDVISDGRVDFAIGAGWNEEESSVYGIPLYVLGERIRQLGEACEVVRRLWTETVTDFDGRYYQLTDARCEPKPVQKPYPPFDIGGGRLAAGERRFSAETSSGAPSHHQGMERVMPDPLRFAWGKRTAQLGRARPAAWCGSG